jgi:hypothetical protein
MAIQNREKCFVFVKKISTFVPKKILPQPHGCFSAKYHHSPNFF